MFQLVLRAMNIEVEEKRLEMRDEWRGTRSKRHEKRETRETKSARRANRNCDLLKKQETRMKMFHELSQLR